MAVDVSVAAQAEKLARDMPRVLNYLNGRRLVPRVYRRDMDDVSQDCCVAVYRALPRFDPSRGVKFKTYAMRAIRQEVRLSIRRNRMGRGRIKIESLDAMMESATGGINPPAKCYVKQRDAREVISRYEKYVTPQQWEAITSVYLAGELAIEFAERKKISPEAAGCRLHGGIERIRTFAGLTSDHWSRYKRCPYLRPQQMRQRVLTGLPA